VWLFYFLVVCLTFMFGGGPRFFVVLGARTRAGRLGNTSFTLHLEFVRHGDAQQVAEADITYVLIQPSKMVKAPIPAELRETLEVGAPGVLISHAGE
jgi:acyl-CoA thioester hydrolase